MATELVGSTGRYGSRYGRKIRRRVLAVEQKQKKASKCPYCGFSRVKRKSKGIFICSKCNTTFAGGTYLPETMSGSLVRKIVNQKAFASQITAEEKEKYEEEVKKMKEEEQKTVKKKKPEDKEPKETKAKEVNSKKDSKEEKKEEKKK